MIGYAVMTDQERSQKKEGRRSEHPNLLNHEAIEQRVDAFFQGLSYVELLKQGTIKSVDGLRTFTISDWKSTDKKTRAFTIEACVNGFVLAQQEHHFSSKEYQGPNTPYPIYTMRVNGIDDNGEPVSAGFTEYANETSGDSEYTYHYVSGGTEVPALPEDRPNPFTLEEQQLMARILGLPAEVTTS